MWQFTDSCSVGVWVLGFGHALDFRPVLRWVLLPGACEVLGELEQVLLEGSEAGAGLHPVPGEAGVLDNVVIGVVFPLHLVVVLLVAIAQAIRLQFAIVFDLVVEFGLTLSSQLDQAVPLLSLEPEASVLNNVILGVVLELNLVVVLFVSVSEAVRFQFALISSLIVKLMLTIGSQLCE